MNKYTYTNMYIIKKIISCKFILCWDITALKLIQGLYIPFARNRQDRMRNRFYASFRMAANAKRTPYLTRKVKNSNAPHNKIKSALFWQNSYRLEWYLIIWHYLNLYVYCISFIARHFLLWKIDRDQIQCWEHVSTGTEPYWSILL